MNKGTTYSYLFLLIPINKMIEDIFPVTILLKNLHSPVPGKPPKWNLDSYEVYLSLHGITTKQMFM